MAQGGGAVPVPSSQMAWPPVHDFFFQYFFNPVHKKINFYLLLFAIQLSLLFIIFVIEFFPCPKNAVFMQHGVQVSA